MVHLNDLSADFTCAKCGRTSYGIPGLDVTVGVLILARSWHELEIEKDYDMSIVLAATALECELSRLYCKWKEVEALGVPFDVEVCEEELRRMVRVTDKITNISTFLCVGGIEAFVESSDKWKKAIDEGFPSLHRGSLATDFQRAIFWPRNKVLHQGNAKHSRDDAAKCYSIAWLGIHILKEMDKCKFSASGL